MATEGSTGALPQLLKLTEPRAVAPKLATSRVTLCPITTRSEPTTAPAWTSRPAHFLCSTCIARLLAQRIMRIG